jgi:hypothetical protein
MLKSPENGMKSKKKLLIIGSTKFLDTLKIIFTKNDIENKIK